MKITFVIDSLVVGGAQKVLVLLMERLKKKGHQLTLVTINNDQNDFFDLPPGLTRVALNISSGAQMSLGLLRFRRAILSSKPNVVVSFVDKNNVLTLFAMLGSGVPVVVSEHSDPQAYKIGLFWNFLRWWIYSYASRIIVITQNTLSYFLPKFKDTTFIIQNPVVRPSDDISISENAIFKKPMIISVGRFHEVKQFDRLIYAFSLLKEKHPDWILTIVGDGPLRPQLEKLGRELGLAERLHLPGFVKNPNALLKQAEIFVLSSRAEGFSMVLSEAMACGLAVISTDCPSGPRDIIRDGIDGILVENENNLAIAEAMDRLMSDESERKRLASRGREVIKRFDIGGIVKTWEAMLEQVLSE